MKPARYKVTDPNTGKTSYHCPSHYGGYYRNNDFIIEDLPPFRITPEVVKQRLDYFKHLCDERRGQDDAGLWFSLGGLMEILLVSTAALTNMNKHKNKNNNTTPDNNRCYFKTWLEKYNSNESVQSANDGDLHDPNDPLVYFERDMKAAFEAGIRKQQQIVRITTRKGRNKA